MNLENSFFLQIAVGVLYIYLMRFMLRRIVNPAYHARIGIIIIIAAVSSAALIPNIAIMNILYIATGVVGATLIFGEKKRD